MPVARDCRSRLANRMFPRAAASVAELSPSSEQPCLGWECSQQEKSTEALTDRRPSLTMQWDQAIGTTQPLKVRFYCRSLCSLASEVPGAFGTVPCREWLTLSLVTCFFHKAFAGFS